MTVPQPDPADSYTQYAQRGMAIMYELVRGYLDRDTRQITGADQKLAELIELGAAIGDQDPGLTQVVRERMPAQNAVEMVTYWHDMTNIAVADVLPAAASLIDAVAPPALRETTTEATARLLTGEIDPLTAPPTAISGTTSAHLSAAVVAVMIGAGHLRSHNAARVVVEQQARAGRTPGQVTPGEEVVSFVSQDEAMVALREAAPTIGRDLDDYRGDPDVEPTRLDLIALTQLYMLDHPVMGTREKTELAEQVVARMREILNAFDKGTINKPTRIPAPRTAPAPRMTAEQVTARQRAERQRRSARKNNRRR